MSSKSKIEKNSSYYVGERKDLISMIPQGLDNVLDVGCGTGGLGKILKEKVLAKKVTGIEINAEAANAARSNIDEVISADIENTDLSPKKEYFDLIIFGDVLEHLYNPWKVLNEMKSCLKKDGHILISIPNIRYYRILLSLIFKGEFKYEEDGILDRDHIRFFTFKMLKTYVNGAGFKIIKTKRNFSGHISFILNILFFNIFADFFTRQYIVLCAVNKE